MAPALLTETGREIKINHEEVFGPMAPVIRGRENEAALNVANDTPFGLSAGICTTSLSKAMAFRRDAQAVDTDGKWTPMIFDPSQPNRDRTIHSLLFEACLVDAVEQILGAPARVYYGMLAVVPGNGGSALERPKYDRTRACSRPEPLFYAQ